MTRFFRKLTGAPVRDPSVLSDFTLPRLDNIERYDDAERALLLSESTDEAVAVVLAYVLPKADAKGAMGNPVTALNALDRDVPERRAEIQLVRRYLGMTRKGNRHWDVFIPY